MNLFKKNLTACVITLALAATGTVAAEQTATAAPSNTAEIISNLEKALAEVNNSSFAEARLHLKTARTAAESMTGDHAKIAQALASVVQGQIQANKGNVKESADQLSNALVLFKAL